MEDDTWSTSGSGWRKVLQGGRWNPLESEYKMEALYIASDGICNFLRQPSVLVYFYSWPLFWCRRSSNIATSPRRATPLGLLIVSFYGPPSSYRDCTCSGVILSFVCPPTNFIVSSCASTKFAVKLEAFITRARKRTRPPSENENNRKRNKLVEISSRISPTNPRYRCSLIFLSFLSLFSFSTFKDCDCVRGSSSREQRPLHRRLVYFSWQMFRGRWKEGIRVAKFIPVFFPPSARNTVLYIYIYA